MEEASGGDFAYTHLRAMGTEDVGSFARDYYPAFNRKGLIVDAMSSFGALPIDARSVRFDALIAASGKCLEGVPGMGFVLLRQAILDSLCAVDVLGFQTGEDGLNFLRTCESLLPQATVNYRRRRVWYRNHATHVRAFPISIDVEALHERAQSEEVAAFRADVEEIVTGCQAIVRIDRLEPSKNIVRGFLALDEMLERHPEHQGHVQFLALLVPSRMDLKEYQDYLSEVMATAGQVNAHYGTSDWEPVRVLGGDSYTRALAAMQRYDVLLVNSIVDGMNLVAKEGPILNERDGVLILSERTGAREQLEAGALIVAPCDVFATAEAMHQALTMPLETRQEWASRLRWTIERQDIAAWLCAQLQALVKLGL